MGGRDHHIAMGVAERPQESSCIRYKRRTKFLDILVLVRSAIVRRRSRPLTRQAPKKSEAPFFKSWMERGLGRVWRQRGG
jgi:hypothetical protein